MIEIDVVRTLGNFVLDVKFTAESKGVTVLFGQSGAGKTSVVNMMAGLLRPDRGRIVVGAHADFILFDPARVGITNSRRVPDFPSGASRLVRDPTGLDGVWVNGIPVFDGSDYVAEGRATGHVLDRFNI